MKIGILVDELAPGSMPKLVGWPIRKLTEVGVEAEAIVIIEKDHWRRYKEHFDQHLSGVKVRYLFPHFPIWAQRINFRFPGMSFFSLHHVMAGLFASRALNEAEFGMIIASSQYCAFAARNIRRKAGMPFLMLTWDPSVFTARKIYKGRMGWKYLLLLAGGAILDRYAVRKCEGIITSGHFHHPYWRSITSKPLHVLRPGCFPLEELPPFHLREPMIVTWDRWDIGNVPNIFLDVLSMIARKDVKLTVGGFWHPESMREEFVEEIRRRGLQNRVELLGPLNDADIVRLCSKAMVHLHPVHEAFGMQTLEAAACGCPGIIPEGSGVAELFENGVSGFHPRAGDIKAMTACVDSIMGNSVIAEKMSRAAWDAARRNTWLDYAKCLKKIVEEHLSR